MLCDLGGSGQVDGEGQVRLSCVSGFRATWLFELRERNGLGVRKASELFEALCREINASFLL